MVFYTEGEDLYRFDAASETREALTSGAAGVLGTLGISTENGSYAYFVATGVLAGNENGNEEKAEDEARPTCMSGMTAKPSSSHG